MLIAADLIRGHTETIILAQLMQRDSYGYEINKTIRAISDDRYELKEATLYTAFKRLEEMGQITSYWGRRPPARGGAITALRTPGARPIASRCRPGTLRRRSSIS